FLAFGLLVAGYLVLSWRVKFKVVFPILLILSIMCSPYFWGYDLVLLFLPLGILIQDRIFKKIDLVLLLLLAIVSNFSIGSYQDFYYVTPLIFILVLYRSSKELSLQQLAFPNCKQAL
ncbi:MAG: hypothetical protein WD512_01785, partial [Candidatus Paceibacterota bacterium]